MPGLDCRQPLHWSSCLPVCSLRCSQSDLSSGISFPGFSPSISFRIKPNFALGLHGLPTLITRHRRMRLVSFSAFWGTVTSDYIQRYLCWVLSCLRTFAQAPSEAPDGSPHSCLLLTYGLSHSDHTHSTPVSYSPMFPPQAPICSLPSMRHSVIILFICCIFSNPFTVMWEP